MLTIGRYITSQASLYVEPGRVKDHLIHLAMTDIPADPVTVAAGLVSVLVQDRQLSNERSSLSL